MQLDEHLRGRKGVTANRRNGRTEDTYSFPFSVISEFHFFLFSFRFFPVFLEFSDLHLDACLANAVVSCPLKE